MRSHYVAVLAATLLFFIAASPGFSQEARSKLRISYPNVSICCLALFAAQQWKTFEQNGLDVEIIQMRSQAANSALASGDIHYVAGVGPNSVAATLRGLPSKAVWFASESLIYSVMARPEFKSLKELRGKRIGLTGLGGTSDVALRIALEAVGENPKDFIIVALGAPQLMLASPVDGGPTLPTIAWQAQLLSKRQKTLPHRHNSTTFYFAFEGAGAVMIENERLEYEQGDIFAVPAWKWHHHENTTERDTMLFSIDDWPAMKKLGFYMKEEAKGF